MKKRYIFLGIISIFTLIFVSTKAFIDVKPRSLETIQATSTLNVATEFSVLNYQVDYDQEQEFGLLYEIMKSFAESQNWQLNVIVENDLSKSIEGLNCGKFDAIMRLLPITSETKDEVSFSLPIFKNYLVLVQRKVDGKLLINNAIELDGTTIFVPTHSPDLLVLRHVSDELGIGFDVEALENTTGEQLLSMVAHGEIDFCITDSYTANYIKKYYPQLDCEVRLGFDQQRAFAFPEHETAVQQLFDDWFVIFRETDEFAKLLKMYL